MNNKVGNLNIAPYNPREISHKSLAALKKSMAEFGDLSGIVYNIRTKHLIGGHQRIKHLDPAWHISKEIETDNVGTVALGHIETPWGLWQYREVDWPENKERIANIAANKHGGEWDIPKLKDILINLDDGEFDLSLTGFDEAELKEMIDDEPESKIKSVNHDKAAPKMVWCLIGVPLSGMINVQDALLKIQSTEGVIFEQTTR